MRLCLVTAAILVGAGLQALADDPATEKAGLTAHQSKEKYWNCLAEEAIRVLPRKMDGQDFMIFIKGRCLDEVKQFRISLISYLSRKHPDVEIRDNMAAADQVIVAAIDDISSTYVDLKSQPPPVRPPQ